MTSTELEPAAGRSAQVGLDAKQLGRVFPFHLVFDRTLNVIQVGRSIPTTCPGLDEGTCLAEFVSLSSPRIPFTFDELHTHQSSLILLRTANKVTLRGQVVAVDDDTLCFVGSPWVTDPALLEQMGITLSDFALH